MILLTGYMCQILAVSILFCFVFFLSKLYTNSAR